MHWPMIVRNAARPALWLLTAMLGSAAWSAPVLPTGGLHLRQVSIAAQGSLPSAGSAGLETASSPHVPATKDHESGIRHQIILPAPAPAASVSTALPPGTAVALTASRPEVAAALAEAPRLEAEWAVQRLVTLTEIPAPPLEEAARASAYAQMLREIGGLDVSIDAAGNVLARRAGRGGGPTVLLAAHLDTVFPHGTDLTVRRDGNRYIAPGIGDNSRGLVSLLVVARLMQEHGIETDGDIVFAGTAGEEGIGNLAGMRHLFASADHGFDRVIAVDGGEIGRIVTTAVGSNRYRVMIKGPGGHSYGAFGTANPHHALAAGLSRFVALATPVTQEGIKSTFSVARLGGGTGVNVIPSESWFEIDLRSADAARLETLDTLLHQSIAEAVEATNAASTRGEKLTVEWTNLGQRPAGTNPPDAPIVADAMAALRHLSIEPELAEASTDANVPIALGIPAVTIGRGGRSNHAHALEEEWIADQPWLGPQLALLLAIARSQAPTRP